MPPTPRISKDKILQASFDLIREKGVESLNARNIAHKLECSTQPIFSVYSSMDELRKDLFEMADAYHSQYFNKIELNENYFLNLGVAYVDFALEETNLFRLLFMSDYYAGKKLTDFIDDENNESIVSGIPETIGIHSDTSKKIFINMWLYAHGIASMLAMNHLQLPRDEIVSMISEVFLSLINEDKRKGRE